MGKKDALQTQVENVFSLTADVALWYCTSQNWDCNLILRLASAEQETTSWMMKHINNEKINSVLKLESKENFNSKVYPHPL